MGDDNGCWKAVCTECVFEDPSMIVKESPRKLIHVISNDFLLMLRDPSHKYMDSTEVMEVEKTRLRNIKQIKTNQRI